MNKRLGTIAIVVAAAATAAGLLASPSNSAANYPPGTENCLIPQGCTVALTGAGSSPSTLRKVAGGIVIFDNTDSVAHTVVFANGLCSLSLTPGERQQVGLCNDNFPFYAGSYAYTVDGKFRGTIVTTPLRRSVTLTARTHMTRRGTRLTLHGQVIRDGQSHAAPLSDPFPVVVLARHNSKQPFEPIATVRARFKRSLTDFPVVTDTYGWKLNVQPDVTTTYIARVTAQPRHGHGRVFTSARSRPFTVRIQH